MPGGRIEIDVVLNNSDVIDALDSAMSTAESAAKSIGAAMLAAVTGGGIAAGLQQVVQLGMEFDSVMNQIRGVSGATAGEMDQVSDKARQLGNDLTLPATSASTAAEAMLELTKGGLSVADSMEAARGSLALAAAAQIEAGQAAEIQANALNTFSLKASDAEHVADVLANTANKSSVGITDLAEALAQGGGVAAQYGMSIEETAGALGVLANNGYKGSDAGTLLKSTLLALQDTGKPAQAAMDTLGVSVYDAGGKFRGLGVIMDQLKAAQKNLTEEEYNHATAVLFGSDAVRLAGVAAKDGAASFNEMTQAVGQQGGAARLAAEMNAGLPGAMEKLQNSAEAAQLALYDLLRGPVTALASFGAEKLGSIADWIGSDQVADKVRATGEALRPLAEGAQEIGQDLVSAGGAVTTFGDTAQSAGGLAVDGLKPILGLAQGAVSGFGALPPSVQTAALAMGAFALARGRVSRSISAAASTDAAQRTRFQNMAFSARQFSGEMRTQGALYTQSMAAQNRYGQTLSRTQQAMAAYRTSTIPAIAATRGFTDQVSQVRQGAAAAGQPISRLAGTMQAMGERGGSLGRIGQSFTNAAAGATRFGTAAGIAAASGTALRTGATGLIGAMGGPFGLAIAGAAIGLSMYSQHQREAAQAAAEHKQVVDGLAASINAETGALNQQGTAQMQELLRKKTFAGDGGRNPYDVITSNKALEVSADQFTQAASGQIDVLDQVNQRLNTQISSSLRSSDAWKQYHSILERAGISADTVQAALRGNEDAIKKIDIATQGGANVRTFSQSLDQAGQDAAELGTQLDRANRTLTETQKQAQQQQQALMQASPAARTLAEAMEVLGDKTASAADKAKALKTALDLITGGAEAVDAARGQGLAEIERLPQLWQAAADAAGGYGQIIEQSTGRVRLDSDATRQLSTSIANVKNAMNEAGTAAYQYAIQQGSSQEVARQAAVTASQGIYDGFMQTAQGARDAGVDVDTLTRQMGLLPPEKAIEFMMLGNDVVKQEIWQIKNQLDAVPNNKPITVQSISDEARQKLIDLGITVRDLPDGRVEVLAETDAARTRINDLLKPETKTITVVTQQDAFDAFLAGSPRTYPGATRATGGPIPYAAGGGIGRDGAIRGPGTGTSDSIHTWAPAGGHVFTARETDAAGGHDGIRAALAALASGKMQRRAAGGPMQRVALSNGEHFATPEQVEAAGGHAAIFQLRRKLRTPSMARGLDLAGPGALVGGALAMLQRGDYDGSWSKYAGIEEDDPRVQFLLSRRAGQKDSPLTSAQKDIAAITSGGAGLLRGEYRPELSNRFFIEEDNPLVAALLGMRHPAQGLSLGGVVRAEQVGKANDGLPYITGARDCSMWVSWMVAAAKGEPLQRLFTTYSLIGGQTGGLVPGASRSDLLAVGTSQEHMAATVMTANGPVNTESGGGSSPSQVRWGRGAAGAFDGQFQHRYHLPLNLINPQPTKETLPTNPASPYIPDSVANRRDQARISGENNKDDSSGPQYIEPPKPPKLEDVAAEAAKIGVRGLLETFGLENSILANPEQSTIGQALQIAANTKRYQDEQSRTPSDTPSTSDLQQLKEKYENEKLERKQQYEKEQAAIREQNKDEKARSQKLLELKQKHDREELDAKQAYDRERNAAKAAGQTDEQLAGEGANQWGANTHTTTQPEVNDPYSLVDSAPYDPAKGAKQWEKETLAALKIAGMALTWKDKMIAQGDIESHGDPKAEGPASSDGRPQGWMQVKPGTFAANRDPKLPDDPFNVLANAVAAAKYSDKQYDGNPPWPTTAGYANGGLFPLRGDKASVVRPNTWRVVGDRPIADEFFIPDTDDPQHVAIGAEWARRRGYQLVQMHADGGIAARAAGGQAGMATALAEPRQETHVHEGDRNYNYSGPAAEADSFFRGARRHDNIVRQGVGVTRTGRKGVRW